MNDIRKRTLDTKERAKANTELNSGPFCLFPTTVNYLNEKITYSLLGRSNETNFYHPFLDTNSWIRCSPSRASRPVVSYRSDVNKLVVFGYNYEVPSSKVEEYNNGVGLYRPLREGEFEFSSSGASQAFFGSRPVLDFRGGIIRTSHNQEDLEHFSFSPTFIRKGISSKIGKLNDESREGVVKRWNGESDFYPKTNGKLAKEFSHNLLDIDGNNLIDVREGNVIDDSGKEVLHKLTSKKLRRSVKYYTKSGYVSEELDELGNHLITYPDTASEGLTLKLLNGNYSLTIANSYKLQAKNFVGQFSQSFVVESTSKSSLKGGSASLVLNQGKVALGASGVEVLDIICEMLNMLSTDKYIGFGALSEYSPQYQILLQKLKSIKGAL